MRRTLSSLPRLAPSRLAPSRLALPLLLAPLTSGCIGVGLAAHRTTAFDRYFETYNTTNAALLSTPHDGVSTLTGSEFTFWVFPGILGFGSDDLEGSSQATFTNGGTHTVRVQASEKIIHTGLPLTGRVEDADAPLAFFGHLDANWRATTATVTQVNGGSTAGQTSARAFTGESMGLRPGASVQMTFPLSPRFQLSGRLYGGYDFPVFDNETLASGYVNYFAREYQGGTATSDESKGIKADLRGFTVSAGVILRFDCGCY